MNRDEFYTAFKHDIITSKLRPGELLKEKQIMQDYGIGRLPMREIMVRLQQENLIETIPRMGTVVTRLDIKHMRDVVELRLELECVVAKLAAERITDEQLGKLRELVEKIHSCADGKSDAAAAWDAQFHQLLYEAAGNAELTRVVNDLLQTMMRLWYYLELWDKDFLSDADGAPNILKALEKRDPDLAQKAMRVHINYSVSRAVTGRFQEGGTEIFPIPQNTRGHQYGGLLCFARKNVGESGLRWAVKIFHAEREGRAGVGEASLRRRLGASLTENIRTVPLGDDPEWGRR